MSNPIDLSVTSDKKDRKWLVLFEEDYSEVMFDAEDNVALLVNIEQAGEIVRLATTAIASISTVAENDQEPLKRLIEKLEEELDNAE